MDLVALDRPPVVIHHQWVKHPRVAHAHGSDSTILLRVDHSKVGFVEPGPSRIRLLLDSVKVATPSVFNENWAGLVERIIRNLEGGRVVILLDGIAIEEISRCVAPSRSFVTSDIFISLFHELLLWVFDEFYRVVSD